MNVEELLELARNAKAFSEAYVRVKEELLRAGVKESEAIVTARTAAMMAVLRTEDSDPWES